MNYVSQRDVLIQFGISLSTLKRRKKNRGFPKHLSLSEVVYVYEATAIEEWIEEHQHAS
tara:strand:+ start:108 stop:284 length:177 start_codon:yes stop_codon:yes gene_type:complete